MNELWWLRPGAVILSNGTAKFFESPLKWLFTECLLFLSYRKYVSTSLRRYWRARRGLAPEENWLYKWTHVRVYLGEFHGKHLVYECTWPAGRIVLLEPWMVDPDYSEVYFFNELQGRSDEDLRDASVEALASHNMTGRVYDVLQALGIFLGTPRVDGGGANRVCSVAARVLIEALAGKNLSDGRLTCCDTWETLPAFFANDWRFGTLCRPK